MFKIDNSVSSRLNVNKLVIIIIIIIDTVKDVIVISVTLASHHDCH